MTLEYRNPSAEEGIVPALSTTVRAFGGEIRPYEREHLPKLMPPDRIHCAYERGQPVGTAAAYPFEMTIPGGQAPLGGVTWVGVIPSHRRRGVMAELMRRQLTDLREREEPLAALWASEPAIYGRFGYGIAAPVLELRAETAGFRFRGDPTPVGRVRLVEREEARTRFVELYEHIRPLRAAMLTRNDDAWDVWRLADEEFMRDGFGPKFYALYEHDGAAEAYATYRVKGHWDDDGIPRGEVRVIEALATTPDASRELWRFLFGIDLTARVQSFPFDPASPLFLSVVDARRLRLALSDGLWLRLVDVERALAARSYAADDELVVEVADDVCDWNAGRFRVGTTVGRTRDAADLRLDVGDLASAYLGAFTFERLAAAQRVDELTDGARARATALFRTDLPPFCPEIF